MSDHYILIDDKHLQYSKVYQPFNNFNEIRELIQILEDATLCTKITGQEFIDLFESNRYVISTDQTTTYELYELFRDFENYCSSTQYIFDMEDLEHFAKFFERFENKIYLDFFVKMLRICGNDVELLNKFLYVFTKILGPDVGYFSNKGILDSYTFINDNIKILQKLKDILNLRYGENFNIVFSNIVTILNMELENGSTEFTRTFLDYFIYSYAKGDLNYFIEILSNIYPEDYIDFIEEINQNIEKMRNK